MTLKSALQDVKETTLAAVSGLLGKLAYLSSLRRAQGAYEHWGMELVHGAESSERALKTAHAEIVAGVLRTPLASLVEDLKESSRDSGLAAGAYVEEMRDGFRRLAAGRTQGLPGCQLTLIQCCWRFRAWRRIEGVPLGQFHSHSHDLAEHFGFLRMPQNSNRNRR